MNYTYSTPFLLDNTKYYVPPSVALYSDNVMHKNTDPKLWGPHLWSYMHYSAANYPEYPSEKEIQDMVVWLKVLPVTIPCVSCKQHYGAYIENNKDRLYQICSSKNDLFNFFVDIHNKVNERSGKPTMTYEDAKRMY